MSKISDYTITELLDKVSLVDLINKYTELYPSGNNFAGKCPFHQDEESSLIVIPKHKIYKCSSCDSMGNIFVFLMHLNGADFPETVENLAEEAGIEFIETKEAHEIRKQDLYPALKEASQIYQDVFWNSAHAAEARLYMRKRGFTDETLLEYKIGFAPDLRGWNFLVRSLALKYDFPLLEKAGLVFKSDKTKKFYDYFRNRILFPWFDAAGRVIGFGGRTMSTDSEEVKYLNTKQTPVFEKQKTLYLLNIARKIQLLKELVLVEGYTDGLMAHQKEHKNTVVTGGTAFTRQHAVLLKRISDKVLACFDPDSAGKESVIRAATIMQTADIDSRIVELPEGKDPADYIKDMPEEFKNRLEEAVPLLDFALHQAMQKYPSDSALEKSRLLKELAPFIRAAPDAPTCKVFIDQISKQLNLEFGVVADFVDYRAKYGMPAEVKLSPFPTKMYEEQIACLLLRQPAYRNFLTMELSAEQFSDPAARAVFSYFCCENAKDDAINFQNGLCSALSLFDSQYTANLPEEVIAYARKNKMQVNESDVYKLISVLQRTPAPALPAETVAKNFLHACYRYEMQELSIDLTDAHTRKDIDTIERLLPKYDAIVQKLRSSRQDSLK